MLLCCLWIPFIQWRKKNNIWNIWYQFTLVWISVILSVPGVQRGCEGMLKPSDILIKGRPEREMPCMTDSCDRQSRLRPQFNCVKRIKLNSPHWDMTFGAGWGEPRNWGLDVMRRDKSKEPWFQQPQNKTSLKSSQHHIITTVYNCMHGCGERKESALHIHAHLTLQQLRL